MAEQGAGRWRLLKGEPRTRVLRLEADGFPALVLKIYATPSRLAWRTLGMVSRANREFTVMMEAHRRGLPVVRPRYRLEVRRAGCLRFGALALEAVDGLNLETVLDRDDLPEAERQRLGQLTGDMLGCFHRQGLQWATATPRNLLLLREDPEPLQAIDMPYATLANRDIRGNPEALMDLSCVLRMSDGRLAFEGEARRALMVAYCAGDESAAGELDDGVQLQTHLAWKKQRLRRRVRNLMRPTLSSSGPAGFYDAASGDYRTLERGVVFLPR
jgi:tRNA A-37 threonylcarbamoyl transferase component Bud32